MSPVQDLKKVALLACADNYNGAALCVLLAKKFLTYEPRTKVCVSIQVVNREEDSSTRTSQRRLSSPAGTENDAWEHSLFGDLQATTSQLGRAHSTLDSELQR